MSGRGTGTRPGARRWALALTGGALALGLLASACSTNTNAAGPKSSGGGQSGTPSGQSSSGGASGASPSASPTKAPPPPAPVVSASPRSGSGDISPSTPATVTVKNGTLSNVVLTSSSGVHVKLAQSADRSSVTTAQTLGYGKTYTWSGRAVGAEGRAVRVAGHFQTVAPGVILHASVNIGDGDKVGIAAPIIITFGGHVTDQAAAEKALTVKTSVPTTGSWAWLPDDSGQSRVHWRPEHYWKPGTKVTVSAKLLGVNYGGGAFGEDDVTSKFSIGRSQIVKANVKSYRLLVYRNGKKLFDFPASYGLESDPNRNTHNGIHIVMEKFAIKYMSNPAYGYKNVPEPWSVRISNNGEFIHNGNSSLGVQGSANVSHGCVNLDYANALAYYNTVLYGDPVEVTGSPIELNASDGDVYDWAVPWSQWTTYSALHH